MKDQLGVYFSVSWPHLLYEIEANASRSGIKPEKKPGKIFIDP